LFFVARLILGHYVLRRIGSGPRSANSALPHTFLQTSHRGLLLETSLLVLKRRSYHDTFSLLLACPKEQPFEAIPSPATRFSPCNRSTRKPNFTEHTCGPQ